MMMVMKLIVLLVHLSFVIPQKDLQQNIQDFAKSLSCSLHSFHENATSYSTLNTTYQTLSPTITLHPDTHWRDSIYRISNRTDGTFSTRQAALLSNANRMERVIAAHQWSNTPPSYNDSDFRRKGAPGFTTQMVNWYYRTHPSSDVFIPVVTTIDNTTNNDIIWTDKLVDMTAPPSHSYFIGTNSGVLRFFPGTEWPQSYDMYDVRHQSWYLEAASSMHDIALLVDRSGSVQGITLKTIRGIVRLILNLIPTNHRFNVFLFNNETIPLKPCYGMEPLPATPEIKSAFLAELDNFREGEPGFLNRALHKLDETFFKKSIKDKACKRMIILFTDGKIDFNIDKVKETLQRLNAMLFVLDFASPLSSGPNKQLKNMACEVNGKYWFVGYIGDWFTVSDIFLDIISPKKVTTASSNLTSPRLSDPMITFYLKKSMLLSYPLFNRTREGSELKGVIGTEVMLDALSSDLSSDLGSLTYEIIVLKDGKVISHPRLLKSSITPLVSQILLENDRNRILYPLDSLADSPVTQLSRRYTETIKGVDYHLMVPLNDAFNVTIPEVDNELLLASKIIGESFGKTLFIKQVQQDTHPFRFGSDDVGVFANCGKGGISTSTITINCPDHQKYVLPVIRDVVLTNEAVKNWSQLKDDSGVPYVKGNFLITRAGVLRSSFKDWSGRGIYQNPIPRKVTEYLEFSADPQKFPNTTLLVTRPPNRRSQINLSKSVSVTSQPKVGTEESVKKIVMSVLGTGLKLDAFSASVQRLLRQSGLDSPNYAVFLLDHKGFVIHSLADLPPLTFFGEVNSAVFNNLVDKGYYSLTKFKDCTCTDEGTPPSSSASTASLFIRDLVVSAVINTIWVISHASSFIIPNSKITHQCCREIRAYERDLTLNTLYHSDEYNFCDGDDGMRCMERYAAVPIPDTNLLLVVIIKRDNPNCNCVQALVSRVGDPVVSEKCEAPERALLNDRVCYEEVQESGDTGSNACDKPRF